MQPCKHTLYIAFTIMFTTCSVLPKLFMAPVPMPFLRRFRQVTRTIPI